MSTPEAPASEQIIGEIRLSGMFAGNRYQILKEVAKGGMGVVYKAHDTVLDKTVALKLILYREWSEDQLLRFQREAQASSRLLHPNIAIVYNFGLDENNTPYMVLEYVEGKTIKRILSKKTFSVLETLEIAEQLCAALHHAHLNGLIHRDIKSSNVILDTLQDRPLAKIIDFGIARIVDAPNFQGTLTSDTIIPGSPPYMAPEQIKQQPTDLRCDIYSLGCVLFEMLTGETPFRGDTAIETMEMHISTQAPLLSSVSADVDFPEELEGMIAKCLAKNPADRYQTANELKTEIENLYDELQERLEGEARTRRETNDGSEIEPDKSLSSSNKTTRNVLFATIAIVVVLTAVAAIAQLYGYLTKSNPNVEVMPLPKTVLKKNVPLSNETDRRAEDIFATLSQKVDLGEVAKTHGKATFKRYMGANAITEEHLKQLRAMSIVELDLSYSQMPSNGLELIGQINSLVGLRLAQTTNVTDAGIKNLSGLKLLRGLSVAEHPNLTGNTLSSLQAPDLWHLGLRKCPSITVKSLKSLAKFKALRSIDLQGIEISKEHLQALTNLPNLQVLALSGCRFKPGAVEVLPQLQGLTQLQLAKTNISDPDLEKIARIKGLSKIDIERCQNLTAVGIERFKLRLPDCELAELELPWIPSQDGSTSPLPEF